MSGDVQVRICERLGVRLLRATRLVCKFEHEVEARRFMAELKERLKQFDLTMHEQKTRLLQFGRFAAQKRARRDVGKPETFNFLGSAVAPARVRFN